jgi:chemotaxis methyl-accepting protein methylase
VIELVPDDGFDRLAAKITRETDFRCASYKDQCLRRRIAVRMRARGTTSFESYASLLDADREEYQRLLDALTVNVTKFFRNPSTYEALATVVVPELWARGRTDAWSAGTASGEEAYSLGALFHEYAAARGECCSPERVSIVGTDIDRASLRAAECARYAPAAFADTEPEALARLFPVVDGGCRTVRDDVRALVRFERRDLLRDPMPAESFDLVACRNVIIYLDRDAQYELLASLHRALRPRGFLVLGRVERLLGGMQSLFEAVCPLERIYRKIA